ncbi:MAG: hypothetical protein PHO67_08500 [Candidatus Omnitrophica bacterium]|nr:hypothetical protein [Candidatus Omnitrophota bacterium]
MRKVIVLLVVLLAVAGCDLFAPDPFLGVWVYGDILSLFFDQNGVVMNDKINHVSYDGEYYYDDDTLTIEWIGYPVERIPYEFIGDDILRLYGFMDFVKQ